MASVGQEVRPEVPALGLCKTSDRFRLSAFGTHALQALGGTKHDYSVAVPCTPGKAGRVGNFLRRPSVDFHPLQFPAGNKTNRTAVGGPEWLLSSFGSGKTLRSNCA